MRNAVVHYSASLMQDISVVPGALGRVDYRDNTGGAALPSWDGRHTYTVLTRESSRSSSATLDGSPVAYALRDGEGEAEGDARIRRRLVNQRPSGVGRHHRGRGD